MARSGKGHQSKISLVSSVLCWLCIWLVTGNLEAQLSSAESSEMFYKYLVFSSCTTWLPDSQGISEVPRAGSLPGIFFLFFYFFGGIPHRNKWRNSRRCYNGHSTIKCLCLAIKVHVTNLPVQSWYVWGTSTLLHFQSSATVLLHSSKEPQGTRQRPRMKQADAQMMGGPEKASSSACCFPQASHLQRLAYRVVPFQHYAVVLDHQIEKFVPFQPPPPFLHLGHLRPNRLSVHTLCLPSSNPPLPLPSSLLKGRIGPNESLWLHRPVKYPAILFLSRKCSA